MSGEKNIDKKKKINKRQTLTQYSLLYASKTENEIETETKNGETKIK